MLKQFWKKREKIARGFYRTRLRGHRRAYSAETWWDTSFFTAGVGDRQTIDSEASGLSAAYHYASVELLILRHLRNHGLDPRDARTCDLGSGAGHWIDFYLSLGATRCSGIDLSFKSIDFLNRKYANRSEVSIHRGKAYDILQGFDDQYDLVNAIGFMFHLVDDGEWQQTISQVARVLRPGGLFVVGGHFGWLDDLNIQFDSENMVNKRLHSASRWKRVLKRSGFDRLRIYRNSAYLFVNDVLPENNVLAARKAGQSRHSLPAHVIQTKRGDA